MRESNNVLVFACHGVCDNDNMACEISCLHKYHFINVARLQYCQMTCNMSLARIALKLELEEAI